MRARLFWTPAVTCSFRFFSSHVTPETPSTAVEWQALSKQLAKKNQKHTIVIQGTTYDSKQCLEMSLQMKPTDGMTWYLVAKEAFPSTNLFKTEPYIEFGGEKLTKRACLVRAVSFNASIASAWLDLGRSMPCEETIETLLTGESVTKRDCLVRAIQNRANLYNAWLELGRLQQQTRDLVQVEVNNERFCAMDCFRRAVEAASGTNQFGPWMELGNALASQQTSTSLGDRVVTSTDCFAEVIERRPEYAFAWYKLAKSFAYSASTTVKILGKDYTYRDCVRNALELDSSIGVAWRALATILDEGEEIFIRQEKITREDCQRKMLECQSKDRKHT